MKDAKVYMQEKFALEFGTDGLPYTSLAKVLNDPRLKIELLPPSPRFEWKRNGFNWYVIDLQASPTWVVATFIEEDRAIAYAKWQNSLEE